MNNSDLRNQIKKHGFTMWQIADLLGVSEATITRKFRHELSHKEADNILNLLKKEGEKNEM